VLSYLKDTIDLCLYCEKTHVLEGYCDVNWVSDDKINSPSGYIFTLARGAISWKFAKQACIVKPTMKFEFVVGQELKLLDDMCASIHLWRKPTPLLSLQHDLQ